MNKNILIIVTMFFLFTVLFSAHIVFAAHSNFDMVNLSEQVSGLADAYFKISIREVWDVINSSSQTLTTVTIGIFDSGIDTNHPEFSRVNLGSTPIGAKIDNDSDGHGTQVAGIIGANNISFPNSANYQFPQMNGILSGAHNFNYTLEVRNKSVLSSLFNTRKRIDELIKSGSFVINLSLSNFIQSFSGFFFDKILSKVFQTHSNTLFIVAAGNDNRNADLNTPANLGGLQNVITVGATALNDQRFNASNFGNAVGVAAPGDQVYAPRPLHSPLPLDAADYDGNFTDTSASAPMVTGVAGLIKAINPSLAPYQIKQILIETADPLFAPAGSDEAGKLLGFGCTASSTPSGHVIRGCRLNALAAVCDPLVLDCKPKGTLVFEDDFEIYALGDLAGQGGWEQLDPLFPFDTSVHIVNTQAFSGNQSVEQQYIDHRAIKRIDTPVKRGSAVFWSKVENLIDASFQLAGSAHTVPVCGVKFDGSFISPIAGQTQAIPNTASLQPNVWRKTEIQWNAEDNTCRFNINDGVFTNWLLALNNFDDVDTIALQANFPGAINQNIYYDLMRIFEF